VNVYIELEPSKAYNTSESFLQKSLVLETFARKLAQVTCKSSCKLNNKSCRLKLCFVGTTVLWFWLANHSSLSAKQNFPE